jgi:predicted nucleic acid-binding protein
MVQLDTNLLIALAERTSPHRAQVVRLMRSWQPLSTSAIAWYEFLKGPLSPARLTLVAKMLSSAPVHFTDAEASEAARLFNAVGRSRRFNVDAMIAASAITTGAELATANPADFKPFVPHGLKLFVF